MSQLLHMVKSPGYVPLVFSDSEHCMRHPLFEFIYLVLSVLGVWYRHGHLSPVDQ